MVVESKTTAAKCRTSGMIKVDGDPCPFLRTSVMLSETVVRVGCGMNPGKKPRVLHGILHTTAIMIDVFMSPRVNGEQKI